MTDLGATYATPTAALDAAVRLLGSQAAMGRLLGVAQPSVWRWLHKQQKLPPEHVIAVEAATGISRHDLRPDIYPREAAGHASAPDRFEAAR